MGINVFNRAKGVSRFLGRVVNSNAVSTISNDLVKGGQLANKVLDNPAVKSLAVAGGPDTMALYAGARMGASGAVKAGQGIQRAKKIINSTPFVSS